MEIKVSEGRNVKARDPVVAKQGVFACVESEELTQVEKERTERPVSKKQVSDTKVWSISEIAKRLTTWLNLTK